MKRLLASLVLLLLLPPSSAARATEGGDEQVKTSGQDGSGFVRRPVFAGSFYEADADRLAAEVDRYLERAEVPRLPGELVALISPHAGHVYSGAMAARGYSYLRENPFDTVIVVAPSHRFPFRGASVFGGVGYMTPLGTVEVDREMADAIADESSGIAYEPMAHAGEHSLEVQVPFLQRALGDFGIVPIIMGSQRESMCRLLAGRISKAVSRARAGGKRVLLVASTDLSHFHDYDTAVALDSIVMDRIRAFDAEGLLEDIAHGRCEACGGGPTAAVMMAARELGADAAIVLGYTNSGDITGDRSGVVGYTSAALVRREANPGDLKAEEPGHAEGKAGGERTAGEDPKRSEESASGGRAGAGDAAGSAAPPYEGVTLAEKRALLALARGTIEAALGDMEAPQLTLQSPALDAECGAFVTLHKQGRLRGCIGYVRAVKPLRDAVADMALKAAFHDPRFPAVSKEELGDIDIEISVLSPLAVVDDVSQIEVGTHGLVMQEGARSGLLLPQVPVEQGWDRDTFLDHTCLKAGLAPGSWKRESVVILKFTAEVFGELQLGVAP